MSLRKMSGIVPDALAEIMRLIDARQGSVRESVQDGVQVGKACIEDDLQAENQPVDPRKRVMRVREGKQLE